MFKTVATTFTLTAGGCVLLGSLFAQSLLGLFGLAYTSAETLARLHHAQAVVEKLQARHALKKQRAAKRVVKRSARRLAAVGLAAATVGTAAVVVTVASLEADDYCAEQQALQEEADLLYDTASAFDYAQCLAAARSDYGALASETLATLTQATEATVERSRDAGREAWARVRATALELLAAAGSSAQALWDALAARIGENGGVPPAD